MLKRLVAATVVSVLLPSLAAAAPITSLYVFGDSLSDQGNGFAMTGGTFPPPPYAQRASNGPVAVERLATRLGVPLAPSALGGTNYAVVGAATGPVVIPGSSPPVAFDNLAVPQYGQFALAGTGILSQVGSFLVTGPVANPANALFVVWGGPNDFFLDPSASTASNAVGNLSTAIGQLYGNGARRFLVPNMPDLSLTPSGLGLPPVARAGLQALSIGFNLGLASALDQLAALPGIEITRFNTFALLTAMSTNPGAFGFANATTPCLTGDLGTGGVICANPDSFVFWDTVHPTTAADAVLGNRFADAIVPEPASLSLMALALGTGAMAARRRRR